jgi:nucleotide-binding universal stress UspA family protein
MDNISRILVADDLVREDKAVPSAAVELGIGLAQALHADLHLVHVYDLPRIPVSPDALNLVEAPYVERMANVLEAESESLKQGRLGLNITSSVEKGQTTEVLLRVLAEQNCQLLVLGTHSDSERRNTIGRVVEDMLRRSPVPVVTVNPDASIGPRYELKSIVVPVDFSSTTTALAGMSCELATRVGADVALIHVLEEWAYPVIQSASLLAGGFVMPLERDLQELANQRVAELDELAKSTRRLYPSLKVTTRLIERAVSVDDGIIETAAAFQANLILMGHRHRSRFSDAVLGSTSRAVVRDSDCPVLTLSPQSTEKFQQTMKKSA